MRIPDAARADVLRDVGGNEPDCALACGVIETLLGGKLMYRVRRHPDGALEVRMSGLDMFTGGHVRKLYALSLRVTSVEVSFAKGHVRVHVAPGAAPAGRALHQAACQRTRQTAIDYAASGVTDGDDVRLIDDVVSDVYNSARRMPDTRFWFEPVLDQHRAQLPRYRPTGTGAGPSGGAPHGGSVAAAPDDASESSVGAGLEQDRAGYSLCFANPPDVTGAFMQHLSDAYGQRLAGCFAWLGIDAPLFVVNVRRAAAAGTAALAAHLPRPLPGLKRRATRQAADAAGDEDASDSQPKRTRR